MAKNIVEAPVFKELRVPLLSFSTTSKEPKDITQCTLYNLFFKNNQNTL